MSLPFFEKPNVAAAELPAHIADYAGYEPTSEQLDAGLNYLNEIKVKVVDADDYFGDAFSPLLSKLQDMTPEERAGISKLLAAGDGEQVVEAKYELDRVARLLHKEAQTDAARWYLSQMALEKDYTNINQHMDLLSPEQRQAASGLLTVQQNRKNYPDSTWIRRADRELFDQLEADDALREAIHNALALNDYALRAAHQGGPVRPAGQQENEEWAWPGAADNDETADDVGPLLTDNRAEDEGYPPEPGHRSLSQVLRGYREARQSRRDAAGKISPTAYLMTGVSSSKLLGKDVDKRLQRWKYVRPLALLALGWVLKSDMTSFAADDFVVGDGGGSRASFSGGHPFESGGEGSVLAADTSGHSIEGQSVPMTVPDVRDQVDYPGNTPADTGAVPYGGHDFDATGAEIDTDTNESLDGHSDKHDSGPSAGGFDPDARLEAKPEVHHDTTRPDGGYAEEHSSGLAPDADEVKPVTPQGGHELSSGGEGSVLDADGHSIDGQKTPAEPDTTPQPDQPDVKPPTPEVPIDQQPQPDRTIVPMPEYNAATGDGTLWDTQQEFGKSLGAPMTDSQTQALTQGILDKNGMSWEQATQVQSVNGQAQFNGQPIIQLTPQEARSILEDMKLAA